MPTLTTLRAALLPGAFSLHRPARDDDDCSYVDGVTPMAQKAFITSHSQPGMKYELVDEATAKAKLESLKSTEGYGKEDWPGCSGLCKQGGCVLTKKAGCCYTVPPPESASAAAEAEPSNVVDGAAAAVSGDMHEGPRDYHGDRWEPPYHGGEEYNRGSGDLWEHMGHGDGNQDYAGGWGGYKDKDLIDRFFPISPSKKFYICWDVNSEEKY